MIQKTIAESIALKVEQVEKIVSRASHSYYHFRIPKRSGGMRDIYHPSQELKLLQRWLIKRVFLSLPVSRAAAAYEEGCSIARNARRHVDNRFLLRMDFSNFFPSLTGDDVKRLLARNRELVGNFVQGDGDLEAIRRITCRFGALTIGAPSSPILSNRIMEPFDALCLAVANGRGVIYSRYADDLFFSCSERDVLPEFPDVVVELLRRAGGPRLQLNPEKTVYSSKKARRVVTGLKLTSENRVSLGRELKRAIRTKVYLALEGALSAAEVDSLRGLLAFANDAEPSLLERLRSKYGADSIRNLLK